MALIKAKKIQILALKSDENQILDFIQNSESFRACDCSEDFWLEKNSNEDFSEVEKNKWEIEFAINFLKPYSGLERSFKYAFLWDKEITSVQEINQISSQYNFKADTQKCKDYEKSLNALKSKNAEINKEIALLSKFKEINFDLNQASNLETVEVFLWEMKKISFSLLKQELEQLSTFIDIIEIQSGKTKISFSVLFLKEISSWVKSILTNFWVNEFKDFKSYANVSEYLKSANEKLKEIKLEEKDIIEKVKILSNSTAKLKICYDYYSWVCDQKQVSDLSKSTETTFLITGWVSWNRFNEVSDWLVELTNWIIKIDSLALEKWENPPIEIVNNAMIKPFEVVSSLYGLPKSNEFDPTPFISVFFWIFFAFCLTDAVYWFLIFLASMLALKLMIVPKEKKPFLHLWVFVWISTTIMWVLFWWYAWIQEYFDFPKAMKDLQLFDMAERMNDVMMLAFWLWFIHLLFWTILKWIHSWKNWKKMSAIFMNFSWIIFFAVMWMEIYLKTESLYIWITAWIMAICLSYDTKWFIKIIAWPFNLLKEWIDWWSNILSYARLFALWISTWIVAIVFNQIALTVWDMLPPVISIIVIVLIILIGHTLNIAMNSLWSFIHSARLQFVEFYWKFMEWWWKWLNPLKKKSTYTYVE